MAPAAWVFDAYGTLFDVHSVARRCDSLWPGKGAALSSLWRAKQLEYTWQRSLMQRYRPFSGVTRDALAYACEALGLELTAERMEAVMGEYLMLSLFPDVKSTLEKLLGKKRVILSNGSPDMLDPLVRQSGLRFDAVLSVDARQVYKPPRTLDRDQVGLDTLHTVVDCNVTAPTLDCSGTGVLGPESRTFCGSRAKKRTTASAPFRPSCTGCRCVAGALRRSPCAARRSTSSRSARIIPTA